MSQHAGSVFTGCCAKSVYLRGRHQYEYLWLSTVPLETLWVEVGSQGFNQMYVLSLIYL